MPNRPTLGERICGTCLAAAAAAARAHLLPTAEQIGRARTARQAARPLQLVARRYHLELASVCAAATCKQADWILIWLA